MVNIGNTNIKVSNICIGTWSWGSRILWGYGKDYTETDVISVYEESLKSGINFFDTAEVYGMGNSERILGRCIRNNQTAITPVIATKFMPFPWRLSSKGLRKYLLNSMQRLGLTKIDLYQIHQPINIYKWIHAIADVYEEGLINAIGVSNYNVEQFKQAYYLLDKRGIKLASNQIHYSLLHRNHEFDGLLNLCRELNVTFLAYSPLAQGVLTGKYSPQNPPTGILRGLRYRSGVLKNIQPLIKIMTEISKKHGGQALAQVAINWVLSKGAIPIVGVKNMKQFKENIASLNWQLSNEDIAILDDVSKIHI
ncbi:aldo/keto reductase [Chloroflexota bacterium]